MNSTAKVSTNPTQYALVPVEPTEEMLFDAGTHYAGANGVAIIELMAEAVTAAITASPNAGKVSRDQLHHAINEARLVPTQEALTKGADIIAALKSLGLSVQEEE